MKGGAVSLALGLVGWGAEAGGAERFEACLVEAEAAFEARLSAALNAQAAPNFEIVRGADAGDCAAIALLACGLAEAAGPCRAGVAARTEARVAAWTGALPAPDAVAGRNPVWSDGLYPSLWARVAAGPSDADCGEDMACRAEARVDHVAAAAALWQTARVIGVATARPEGAE